VIARVHEGERLVGGAWDVIPPYEWLPLVDGTAVAYATRG
jgi:hypothetical protein